MKTNTKHTPGPWHIGSGNGEGSIFADSGRTRLEIGGTTLYPICQVNRKWEDEEDEANARLIAAAPNMLKALKCCIRELSVQHAPDCSCIACNTTRAVIASATGRG